MTTLYFYSNNAKITVNLKDVTHLQALSWGRSFAETFGYSFSYKIS